MKDLKEIEINGNKFVIKKLSFGTLYKVAKLVEKGDGLEAIKETIKGGLETPLPDAFIEVADLDVISKLANEILNYSMGDIKKALTQINPSKRVS